MSRKINVVVVVALILSVTLSLLAVDPPMCVSDVINVNLLGWQPVEPSQKMMAVKVKKPSDPAATDNEVVVEKTTGISTKIAVKSGPVWIGPNCRYDLDAELRGPCNLQFETTPKATLKGWNSIRTIAGRREGGWHVRHGWFYVEGDKPVKIQFILRSRESFTVKSFRLRPHKPVLNRTIMGKPTPQMEKLLKELKNTGLQPVTYLTKQAELGRLIDQHNQRYWQERTSSLIREAGDDD